MVGKILTAVLVASSMLGGSTMGDDISTRFSISPDPLVMGQKATITGEPGDVIDLDWDPAAEPGSVTIEDDGSVTFTVPMNVSSLIATDPDGNTLATTVRRP
jgi:hypothetical protein